jgi:predicted dithiol-disulfide oxidoreductase (DUF899 family)
MAYPQIVSRDEWLAARADLLIREKEATRARDKLNTERRRLPMVTIDKAYHFEGLAGTASLLDLFDGRRQLIVYHFMFDPSWDDGCPELHVPGGQHSLPSGPDTGPRHLLDPRLTRPTRQA